MIDKACSLKKSLSLPEGHLPVHLTHTIIECKEIFSEVFSWGHLYIQLGSVSRLVGFVSVRNLD